MAEAERACPRCGKVDKVEKVSVIVAEAFPTLQTDTYTLPRRWAGHTYYVPNVRTLNDIQTVPHVPQRLLPVAPPPPPDGLSNTTARQESITLKPDDFNSGLVKWC